VNFHATCVGGSRHSRGFVWVQIRAERPRKQKKKMLQRCEIVSGEEKHPPKTDTFWDQLFLEHSGV